MALVRRDDTPPYFAKQQTYHSAPPRAKAALAAFLP